MSSCDGRRRRGGGVRVSRGGFIELFGSLGQRAGTVAQSLHGAPITYVAVQLLELRTLVAAVWGTSEQQRLGKLRSRGVQWARRAVGAARNARFEQVAPRERRAR